MGAHQWADQLNSTQLFIPLNRRETGRHMVHARCSGPLARESTPRRPPWGVPPSVAAVVVALSLRIAPLPSGGVSTLWGTPPLRHACGPPQRPSRKTLGDVGSPGQEEAAAAAPWPPCPRGPSGRRPGGVRAAAAAASPPGHAAPGSAPCGGRRAEPGWPRPVRRPRGGAPAAASPAATGCRRALAESGRAPKSAAPWGVS